MVHWNAVDAPVIHHRLVFHMTEARAEQTSVSAHHFQSHVLCHLSTRQTVDLATANATEEDKLRAAMDQASQDYHPSQYVLCTHESSHRVVHYQRQLRTRTQTHEHNAKVIFAHCSLAVDPLW